MVMPLVPVAILILVVEMVLVFVNSDCGGRAERRWHLFVWWCMQHIGAAAMGMVVVEGSDHRGGTGASVPCTGLGPENAGIMKW